MVQGAFPHIMYSSQVTVWTVDVSIMTPPADGGRGGTVQCYMLQYCVSHASHLWHTQPPRGGHQAAPGHLHTGAAPAVSSPLGRHHRSDNNLQYNLCQQQPPASATRHGRTLRPTHVEPSQPLPSPISLTHSTKLVPLPSCLGLITTIFSCWTRSRWSVLRVPFKQYCWGTCPGPGRPSLGGSVGLHGRVLIVPRPGLAPLTTPSPLRRGFPRCHGHCHLLVRSPAETRGHSRSPPLHRTDIWPKYCSGGNVRGCPYIT